MLGFAQYYEQVKIEQSILFDKEDGLPDNSIRSVVEDSDGFIWIGTADGLARFDGAEFKVFKHDPNDTTSIYDNRISVLLIDGHRLWIGTHLGLSVMDLKTEKFINYQFDNFKLSDQFSKKVLTRVSSLIKGTDGDIWVGTFSDALFRYSSTQDTFINYRYPEEKKIPSFPLKENVNHILSLAQDRNNHSIIWSGTGAGLLKINTKTNAIQSFIFPQKSEKRFLAQNAIRRIYQHSDGLLYISSWYAKVNIFDPVKEVFYPIPIENQNQEERLEAHSILNTPVGQILPKNEEILFIHTSQGLMTYNTKTKTSVRIQRNDLKKNKLYGVKFIDSQNRVWFPTGQGIHLFDPLQQQFIQYNFEHLNPNNYGFAFYPIADKKEPIITIVPRSADGIYTINYKSNQWSKTSVDRKYFRADESFIALGYSFAPNGHITVAGRFAIYDYDPVQKTFTSIQIPKRFQEKVFYSLCWDHTGKLWIGLSVDGLIRWNPENGEWKTFTSELQEGAPEQSVGTISSLLEDSQQNIWINRNNGFSVYDSKRDTFFNFIENINPENSITVVHNFVEDPIGRVWMNSTTGNFAYAKVNEFEKGIIQKFDLYGRQDIKSINFLRTDTNGTLWGIHEDQLLQITPSFDSIALTVHSLNYGIKEHDKIFGFEILPDGKIVIGGSNKIWIGDPKEFINNPEKPKPYLTNISVLQEPLKSEIATHQISDLNLNYAENFFSFDFSSIGFSHGVDNKFRYRLINFEDKWTSAEKRRFANFTNVPPGGYIFELQVANNEGIWNKDTLQLPIHINAPWWRTIWFWALFILGLIGIIYLIYQWRIKQVRKEERLKSGYEQQLANVKMSALRAQMNPHFIFNSLNSIEFYIMNNEQERAVDYLGRFSRLIRLILQNSKNPSIPLKDELEALKIYMEMECIRFENLFEYEVRTEHNLLNQNLLIPPMLIQPYVENAIWHGLRQKTEGRGKIKITLFRNNGHLVCHIEDNGIGRDAAQKLKSKSSAKRKSYGMKITSDRLDILNKLDDVKAEVKIIDLNDEHGVSIGTKVELTLPINSEELIKINPLKISNDD